MKKTTFYTLICTTMIPVASVASRKWDEVPTPQRAAKLVAKQAGPSAILSTPQRIKQLESEGQYANLSPPSIAMHKEIDKFRIHRENAAIKAEMEKVKTRKLFEDSEEERRKESAAADKKHAEDMAKLEAIVDKMHKMAASVVSLNSEIDSLKEEHENSERKCTDLEKEKQKIEQLVEEEKGKNDKRVKVLLGELGNLSEIIIKTRQEKDQLESRVENLTKERSAMTKTYGKMKEQKEVLDTLIERTTDLPEKQGSEKKVVQTSTTADSMTDETKPSSNRALDFDSDDGLNADFG